MRYFTPNERLAVIAFVLSFAAFFLAFINPDGINDVNQRPNYISVVSLAEKIKNRESLQLIDLRSKELFDEFHLPAAKQMPAGFLSGSTGITGDTLVFYSGDDPLTRTLWRHLPDSLKQRSRILYGGVHDWYERLLYPVLPVRFDAADSQVLNQVHDLSLFFGGQAEFEEECKAREYYQQDLSEASWPKSHRQNGLVRKGC